MKPSLGKGGQRHPIVALMSNDIHCQVFRTSFVERFSGGSSAAIGFPCSAPKSWSSRLRLASAYRTLSLSICDTDHGDDIFISLAVNFLSSDFGTRCFSLSNLFLLFTNLFAQCIDHLWKAKCRLRSLLHVPPPTTQASNHLQASNKIRWSRYLCQSIGNRFHKAKTCTSK